MKTKVFEIEQMTIEHFAERKDLTMEIRERRVPAGSPNRFYARFESCEVMDGRALVGLCGDGPTPEDAVQDYARNIQLKRICIDAMRDSRKEIEVPRLL